MVNVVLQKTVFVADNEYVNKMVFTYKFVSLR